MNPRVPYIACGYVARETLAAIGIAFAFFFGLFFVNQLLLMADDILRRGIDLWSVARLVWYSLPAIVALAVPFATLVGTLMAVGRLSSDSEITAFRAGGLRTLVLFAPIALLALALSVVSFIANDILLPVGTLNFGRLYRQLLYANPALELDANSVRRYQDSVLVTGDVSPGRIDDFVVIDTDSQGNGRVIVADRANLSDSPDETAIVLQLANVLSHTREGPQRYQMVRAERMNYNLLLEEITVAIREPGPREMSSRDLGRQIDTLAEDFAGEQRQFSRDRAVQAAALVLGVADGQSSEQLQPRIDRLTQHTAPEHLQLRIHRLEYHKKFSIPFSAFAFVILAFPIGLFRARSGRGVGFMIGLVLAFCFWVMLFMGQTFGTQRANISPVLAMWLPNIVFVLAGIGVFVFRRRV